MYNPYLKGPRQGRVIVAFIVTTLLLLSCEGLGFAAKGETAVSAPVFSPEGGNGTSDLSVTINCATKGATVYFTISIDGPPPDPNTASAVYTSPLPVAAGTTTQIKARAALAGSTGADAFSAVVRARFGPFLETLPVSGGTFNNGVTEVTVDSFLMSTYEITQAQYQSVTDTNPSGFVGEANCPVERVTWFDAVEFCNKLSEREGLDPVYSIVERGPDTGYPITGAAVTMEMGKTGYRLPTEAEWEFAARGGTRTQGYKYAGLNDIADAVWYRDNSDYTTHEVGTKAANELGLHDLSGNVWEWCWDWHGIYPREAQSNPTGESSGTYRALRGGSWLCEESYCAISFRNLYEPSDRLDIIGFRVVRRLRE